MSDLPKSVYNGCVFSYHAWMTGSEALIIRPMVRSDLDQVMVIERLSYSTPWKPEHFLQEIHSPLSFPFVATVNGEVSAYLCLMSLFEEAQIMNIAVAPNRRGLGLAKKLMELAIETSRGKGAETLVLEVRESNAAAIALYESFGFVRYFVRKRYYDGQEDAILMEKSLKP
jgi:ribosomal-protein-alanine N-acetyltransferase